MFDTWQLRGRYVASTFCLEQYSWLAPSICAFISLKEKFQSTTTSSRKNNSCDCLIRPQKRHSFSTVTIYCGCCAKNKEIKHLQPVKGQERISIVYYHVIVQVILSSSAKLACNWEYGSYTDLSDRIAVINLEQNQGSLMLSDRLKIESKLDPTLVEKLVYLIVISIILMTKS